jgi:hypothetical protein
MKPNHFGTFETKDEALEALANVQKHIDIMRNHAKWFATCPRGPSWNHTGMPGTSFLSGHYANTLSYAIQPPKKIQS